MSKGTASSPLTGEEARDHTLAPRRKPYAKPNFRYERVVGDASAHVRQDQPHTILLYAEPQELVAADPVESGVWADREALGCELAAEVLRRFGELRLGVTGTSMLPAVRPGDVLTVRRCPGAEPQPGEIVLVGRNRRLCAHRIVRKGRDGGAHVWITRGDALDHEDPPVSEGEMLGTVVSMERGGARIEPSVYRSVGEHLLAALLRRSKTALRAFLHFERLRAAERAVEQ